MAELSRFDGVVTPFVRGLPPVDQKKTLLFIVEELKRLENTMKQLVILCPQVAIKEPSIRLRGMIRWNKAPWDPLGTGEYTLVVWDGENWVSVASAAGLALDTDLNLLVQTLTTEQKLTNLILQSSLDTDLSSEKLLADDRSQYQL